MSEKEVKKLGRPPGVKNTKGVSDRRFLTVTVTPECIRFLDRMRTEGHIKGRIIERALREFYEF